MLDGSVTPGTPILSIQDYMAVVCPVKADNSNVVYNMQIHNKEKLMKPYLHMGLKEMAGVSDHPVVEIQGCM